MSLPHSQVSREGGREGGREGFCNQEPMESVEFLWQGFEITLHYPDICVMTYSLIDDHKCLKDLLSEPQE